MEYHSRRKSEYDHIVYVYSLLGSSGFGFEIDTLTRSWIWRTSDNHLEKLHLMCKAKEGWIHGCNKRSKK